MRKTKLTWPDYKKAALKLKSQGLGFPKIYERLGKPIFNGTEYKLESDKGSIKRKTRAAARAGKSSSTKTRNTNQALSTPPGTDRRSTNKLVKQINLAGGHADHGAELSRTGNAMRDMTPERRRLMQQRMGGGIGHQESNIQYLTPEDNLQKNFDYRKLDAHLRKLGTKATVGKPNFTGLRINGNGIKNGVSAVIPDAIEFIPTIDEMIGSPLDRAIGNGVNSVKTALGFKANPVPNGEINPTVQRGLDILSKFYQNGSKAVDTNGISSI